MRGKITNWLKRIPLKYLDRIAQDNPQPKLKKIEIAIINDLAFKLEERETGNKEITEKILKKRYGEAFVVFTLELFKRNKLVDFGEDLIAKRTRLGNKCWKRFYEKFPN